ncbi:hypothetical protein AN960_09650 [Bacillus sp. FJAT-25509]|uniref:lysozyme inhibitor LprI family protein n=1 Tax=Bacillaceae TaxID=186817 RepID=UPI0006FE62FE|nr:lysozyme inhibitor LprI family protein [Bacillus sp. FJAT-25509]KQL39226.1 hypothetical protein AN960_09650 [Bacillus sp. FJAT-25509]
MKKLSLVLATFLLVGCSNNAYDNAMKKANDALLDGEYDKAQVAYELALEEKPDDAKTKGIYVKLVKFNKVKDLFKQQNWDKTIKEGNELLNKKSLPNYLKTELTAMVNNATDKVDESKTVASTTTDETSSHTDDSNGSTDTTQLVQTNEQNSTETGEVENNKLNLQQTYLTKLNDIEASMTDLDSLYKSGITKDMVEAEGEKLNRWDTALNEIYQVLMRELPSSEASKLKVEERAWVKEKERIATNEAAEYKGGTFENVQYMNSLARLTKERAYELVNSYMI